MTLYADDAINKIIGDCTRPLQEKIEALEAENKRLRYVLRRAKTCIMTGFDPLPTLQLINTAMDNTSKEPE